MTSKDQDNMAPTGEHISEAIWGEETSAEQAGGPVSGPIPETIGQYRVKRVIASGGMGTVYEAMQEHPRRRVALKVMRAGITSRSALRRFEYESQILARLRHPGIAQVYEAGTHEEAGMRVPYFAMEYVPNAKTLTDYAEQKKLNLRERLGLFAKVCEAVHHGHQKGIIHRDLKPGNVLVDSGGNPKIIDFGVARSTDSDLAVTTLQTDVGQLIGTLQYMSPEQCDADPNDIDIRSDVYSLGVMIYELLTGALPYEVSRTAVYEATRVIRETPPPRLRTFSHSLRGDVETIVLKAMEKDRDRRYQSAAELGQDIERYLRNEPILARPPSLMYQVQVFARRNKTAFAAIVAVLVVSVVAAIVSTGFAISANTERRSAEAARTQAENALTQVEEARAETVKALGMAEAEAARFERISDFLLGRILLASSAGAGQDGEIDIDRIAGEARDLFGEQHALVAATMESLGLMLHSRGETEHAELALRRAVALWRDIEGDQSTRVADALLHFSSVLESRQDFDGAEAALRDALTITDAMPIQPTLLASQCKLALARLLRVHHQSYDSAEPLARDALAMQMRIYGPNDPDLISALDELRQLMIEREQNDEVVDLWRRIIALERTRFGEQSSIVAQRQRRFGVWLGIDAKMFEPSIPELDAAAQIYDALGEVYEEQYADTLKDVVTVYFTNNAFADALPWAEKCVTASREAYGNEHIETARVLLMYGVALRLDAQYDKAIPPLEESLSIIELTKGAENYEYTNVLNNLTALYIQKADMEKAEPLFVRTVDAIKRQFGQRSHIYADNLRMLGSWLYSQRDNADAAEQKLTEALDIYEESFGRGSDQFAEAFALLAGILIAEHRFAEAEQMLLNRHDWMAREPSMAKVKHLRKTAEQLTTLYEEWDRPADAENWRKRAQALEDPAGGV